MRQGDMKKDAKAPKKDWAIHAYLKIGDTDIMASDTFNFGYTKPTGFHVAVNVETPAEAERIFKALSEGGQVTMKMEETFFAHCFGTVIDRFSTPWRSSRRSRWAERGKSNGRDKTMDAQLHSRELTITRVFDAPRDLVFKAWTDAKMLAEWFGPQGFTNPVSRKPWRHQPIQ